LWGIFGTHYARFSESVRSPFKVFRYLSGQDKQTYLGHNPAGAYSVIVMLTLILSQALSGLFMTDDIFSEGVYYAAVNEQWQDFFSLIHNNAINLIWAIIVFHILSVLYYQFKKKQKLTKAMITGYKTNEADLKIGTDMSMTHFSIRLAACILASALLVYLAIEVLPPESVQDFYY
jgi:cytochrome b